MFGIQLGAADAVARGNSDETPLGSSRGQNAVEPEFIFVSQLEKSVPRNVQAVSV